MLHPRYRFRLTIPRCCFVVVACGLMLTFASPAFAQQGPGQIGGGQNGGGIGGGGTGGGGIGGGGTGGGGGGAGGGGGGGTNTGGPGDLAGELAGPQLRTFGETVDVTDGTGFAGRGNAAQNFVGGLVQGQGQATLGGRGQTNQFQSLNRQGQFRQQFQQPTGPSRSDQIRPRHRIAFSYTPQQTQTVATTLQTWLAPLASNPDGLTTPIAPGGTLAAVSTPASGNPGGAGNAAGVSVTMNDQGVATLTGTVATEHAARLAAAIARQEPGVRSVENQLTVAGEGTTAGP
jgi:hypothetical protein